MLTLMSNGKEADKEQAPTQRTWRCASRKGHLTACSLAVHLVRLMSLGRHNSKCSAEFFQTVPEEHEVLFACQPVMNSFHDLPLLIKEGEKKMNLLSLI